MKCTNCGAEILAKAKFCGKCGCAIKDKQEKIPLSRYFARMIDVLLITLFIHYGDPPPSHILNSVSSSVVNDKLLPYLVRASLKGIFFWHILIEPILISTFGTTPGKALYGIRVLNPSHSKLNGSTSFSRSISVYWQGMGLGFGPLSFIANLISLLIYLLRGITPWDKKTGVVVLSKFSPLRRYLTHLGIVFIFVFRALF